MASPTGMHAGTGAALNADTMAHLRQSIATILTTPIGSRVRRRDFGSRLFQLTDMPLNAQAPILIYAAVADALVRWEPRLKLIRVQLQSAAAEGRMTLILEGKFVPTGQPVKLEDVSL